MEQSTTPESGRSMVEMLGVLAIMGILSITGVIGYKYFFNKYRAVNIINDAQVLNTIGLSELNKNENWRTLAGYVTKSEFEYEYRHDKGGHVFSIFLDIPKEVCEPLLKMKTEFVGFSNEDGELFTTCEEINNVVVNVDGYPMPIECLNRSECEGEKAYCSGIGKCTQCEEGRDVNAKENGCTCLAKKEITCSNSEGDTWCCSSDQLCSETFGECINDFICQAGYTQTNTDNTCHYTYSQTDADNTCHYAYSQTDTDNTCHYTLSINSETNVATLTKVKGCSGNQYCNLKYTNEGCSSAVQNDSTDIWGACNTPTNTIESCKIQAGVLTKVKGCSGNQYCNLKYTNEGCSSAVQNDSTDIWGACNTPTNTIESCKILTADFKSVVSCPGNYYCNLIWKNENCEAIQNDTEIGYGRCSLPTEKKTTCLRP